MLWYLLFQMSNILLRSSLRASLAPGSFQCWSCPNILPAVCQSPVIWLQAGTQCRGAKVKAGAGGAAKGGKGGGKGGAMVKIALEVGIFVSNLYVVHILQSGWDRCKETCKPSVWGQLCHWQRSNSHKGPQKFKTEMLNYFPYYISMCNERWRNKSIKAVFTGRQWISRLVVDIRGEETSAAIRGTRSKHQRVLAAGGCELQLQNIDIIKSNLKYYNGRTQLTMF